MADRPGVWRRLVGETDRVGWWVLPAFLVVGLAGAVMAGALAVVYYSQQVSALEAETRESRQDLQRAVQDVEDAAEDALQAIADEVDSVRDTLERGLPVQDMAAMGLVIVEARVNAPPPESDPPANDDDTDGAPDVQAQASPSPSPSPSPEPIRPRIGVGFAVAFEGGDVFIATSFGLVEDRNARAGVVEEVVVTTPDNQRATGTVHSWEEQHGIALVRVTLDRQPIADWRPRMDPPEPGERVAVAGITPTRGWVQLEGVLGHVADDAMVTTLPPIDFLRGAPIVDGTGRVIAVYTLDYRPFGNSAGAAQAMVPIGLFCERLLQGCDALEADAPEEDGDTDAGDDG
jgi:S1-C subfamily serine protease